MIYIRNIVVILYTVATVAFGQSMYNVSENNTAQIVLTLSKQSSTDISLEVLDINVTAFGKIYIVLAADEIN